MRKIPLYLFSIILFFLSACDCSFNEVTGDTNNYITYNSSVIIFADGCSDDAGDTDSSAVPVPLGKCDDYDGGSWKNRGRWVKVPGDASSVASSNEFSVSVEGSVYYCTYGYDNRNPPPTAIVRPANQKQTFFEYDAESYSEEELPAPTELPVEEGQLIVLDISESSSSVGLAIGENYAGISDVCSDTQYDDFVSGLCRAKDGLGLTVYVGDTEVVTLDNKDISSDNATYSIQKYRYPDLYKPFIPDSELENFYSWVQNKYSKDVSGVGPRKYVFNVPKDLSGVLGFSIAQEAGTIVDGSGKIVAGSGDGYYEIEVMSTIPSCLIKKSIVSEKGERGAVQILIQPKGVNPNSVDTAVEDFDNTSTISEYYPELIQYIASKTGVTITSDASALGELVVFSDYENDIVVMTSEEYNGRANSTGIFWLKVRDDYYHDNVGQYQVNLELTTKKSTIVSEFLADLTDPIIESLDKTTQIIYNSFATSSNWLSIMKMSLMLYIMVYGAQFMLGLAQITVRDAFIRFFKIAVIIVLFDNNSWDFFNQYFFKLFTDGKDFLITAVTGDASEDKSGIFGFVDDVFYTFFAKITWEKLAALLPYMIGLVYIAIFIQVMILYLVAMAQVFIVYLLTLVGIALLLSLAPMFMVTMLFERTRNIFLNWVKYLVDYALQPVILFAALYVMNSIFMTFWNNAMDIKIEYGGVWSLDFLGVFDWTYGVIPSFGFGCIQYYRVIGGLDIFDMFTQVMMLYIFVYTVKAILDHIPTLTESLTGASTASSTSQTAGSIIQSAMNFAQGGDPIEKQRTRDNLNSRGATEEKNVKELRENIESFKSAMKGDKKPGPKSDKKDK